MSVTYFESTDKVTRSNVNTKIDEINFQNATLETNINNTLSGVQLFSSNGTSGTITLSDSILNYDYIEIYYKENTSDSFYCVKIAPTFKSKWLINSIHYSASDAYTVLNARKLTITNTTITQSDIAYTNLHSNQYPTVRTENNLFILKVIGYKNNI